MKKLTVLNTRPDIAGLKLTTAIENNGDRAIHFPTIDFEKIIPDAELIKQLAQQDYIIFISPRAVSYSQLTTNNFSNAAKLFAVGKATANALVGFTQEIIYPQQWHTEGLLALQNMQHIQQKKIAIIKGKGGRELLASELKNRGAIVSEIIVYERVLPEYSSEYIKTISQQEIDLIIATSYESLQNLTTFFGDIYLNRPLLVPGERIIMLAQDVGFQTVWGVPNVSNEVILDMIEQKREILWQMKQSRQ